MDKLDGILKGASFSKLYNFSESFGVTECGFDDFSQVKSITFFHSQPMYTIHYVIKGSGILETDGKTYYPEKGCYFILPPDKNFRYYPQKNSPWKYFWLAFNGENAEKFYTMLTENGIVKTDVSIEKSEVLFSEFFTDYFTNGNTGYYKVLSFFYALINSLCKESYEPQTKRYVQEIKNCIKLNYTNADFNVEAISKIVHVSHSYLCKIFKKETSQTIKNYLTDCRMNEAMKLITETDKPVKDVAYLVGYNDELNFMKSFKRYFGKTATEFR